jgi:uncharacterized repeat protein (TIGR01451 family)
MRKLAFISVLVAIALAGMGGAVAQEQGADLSVTAEPASSAVPGQVLVFTVDVNNAGPWSAEQVVVGAPIPSYLTVIDIFSTAGQCEVEITSVLCSFPELEVGTEVITITTEVGDVEGEEVVFSAYVQSFRTPDPVLVGNSVTVTAPVVGVLASTGVETEVILPLGLLFLGLGTFSLVNTRRFGFVRLSDRTYTGPPAFSGIARLRWRPWA